MNTDQCYVSGDFVSVNHIRAKLNSICPRNLTIKLVAVGSSFVLLCTLDNRLIFLTSECDNNEVTHKLPTNDRDIRMISAGALWIVLTNKSIYEGPKKLKLDIDTCYVKKLISKFNGIAVVTYGGELYICEDHISFTKVSIEDFKFTHASFGSAHSLALSESGVLFTKGANSYGQMGVSCSSANTFIKADMQIIKAPIKFAECGYYHTIVVTIDSEIFGIGWNAVGELGDGSTGDRHSWVKATFSVPNNLDIINLSVGYQQSFIVLTDGSIYCCGFNNYGGLGLGDFMGRSTYQKFPNNHNDGKICVNRPIPGGHFTFYCFDPNFNVKKGEQQFKANLLTKIHKHGKLSDLIFWMED